jgi:predicted anti-sigma-YlaC factor YlaD
VRCEDIRPLLFDYMTHELGEARSVLVHEHLRKCAGCRSEAADMQSALDVLRRASGEEAAAPVRLTRERRARIDRAIAHPLLDWAFRHHAVVSVAIVVAVLCLVAWWLRGVGIWSAFRPGPSYPVSIGVGQPLVPTNAPEPNAGPGP